MSAPRTVDIKLSFERFDMTPGEKGREFRRNLLLHGGRTNARGFSYADCFLRLNEGALAGPIAWAAMGLANPGPAAGAPAMPPGNNADSRAAESARRALSKEAFRFMVAHIDDKPTEQVLATQRGYDRTAVIDSFSGALAPV